MLRNKKAVVGAAILLLFLLIALFAPLIAPGDPLDFVAMPNQPPSAEHWLGTTGQGQDVFAQVVWGTRVSLGVGFASALAMMLIGTILGMVAGYFGGMVDDSLSLLINVFLIIPAVPLAVVLAAYLPQGPLTITLVLAITGWAWNARVLRAQTLSLREKDFVAASLVGGERKLRIIFSELLPNTFSLIVSGFIGATIFAIATEVGLEFLGLGNISTVVSWGTILYWSQNNAGLVTGAWWTIVPPGLCVAVVGCALTLLNSALDEVTNPRLRAEQETRNALRTRHLHAGRATPVLRHAQ
ncbi:MAG TPA: ABC transporter permease [Roseiflexaceae bacterium]|nr:ABC transporter permease [Roseiflexaceae bacterium]